MKNLIKIFIFILLFSFTFVACSQNNKEQMTQDSAQEKTSQYIQMLMDGNYKEVVKGMNGTLKAQVGEESLKIAWEQMQQQAGKISLPTDAEIQQNGDSFVAMAVLEGENSNFKISFTYQAKDSKMTGLWIKPTKGQEDFEENDKYTQSYIKVGEHELTGVLTMPKDKQDAPIVVMVQGSGQSDYDETISQNTPFKDIAIGLAEKGIATIRYNKRYFEKTEILTDPTKITIYDEYIDDVYDSIDMASQFTNGNIYILGHSQGGMSAPKIAFDNPQVSGMISMAGSPRRLEDLMFDQNMISIDSMEVKDTQKNELKKQVQQLYDQVKNLKEGDTAAPFGVSGDYWISLKDLDTLNISKKLEIPMLFLQGEEDFQVYIDKDFEYWKNELSKNPNATFISYPLLNHIFMQGGSKDIIDLTVYDTKGKVEDKVIQDIAEWIDALPNK